MNSDPEAEMQPQKNLWVHKGEAGNERTSRMGRQDMAVAAATRHVTAKVLRSQGKGKVYGCG